MDDVEILELRQAVDAVPKAHLFQREAAALKVMNMAACLIAKQAQEIKDLRNKVNAIKGL